MLVAGVRALIVRDLRLALRRPTDAAVAIGFFVVAASLVPFGVGPEREVLTRIAAGIVWVAALLATLLSLERLFLADAEDGSLDQLALAPSGLAALVLAKAAAHWLIVGLPLLVAAPVIALAFGMGPRGIAALAAALALGTPTLVLIGTVAAALAVGARRGGVLLALLALPLDVPVLIFGAATVDAALAGDAIGAPLQALVGLLIGALVVTPIAGGAALRLALE